MNRNQKLKLRNSHLSSKALGDNNHEEKSHSLETVILSQRELCR